MYVKHDIHMTINGKTLWEGNTISTLACCSLDEQEKYGYISQKRKFNPHNHYKLTEKEVTVVDLSGKFNELTMDIDGGSGNIHVVPCCKNDLYFEKIKVFCNDIITEFKKINDKENRMRLDNLKFGYSTKEPWKNKCWLITYDADNNSYLINFESVRYCSCNEEKIFVKLADIQFYKCNKTGNVHEVKNQKTHINFILPQKDDVEIVYNTSKNFDDLIATQIPNIDISCIFVRNDNHKAKEIAEKFNLFIENVNGKE